MLDLKTVRLFFLFQIKIVGSLRWRAVNFILPMNFQKVWACVNYSENYIVPFVLAAAFREVPYL